MTILVKFCGGCNARFHRAGLVSYIESLLLEIKITYDVNEQADAAVIICGCSAACANRAEAIGTYGTFVIWQDKELSELKKFLQEVRNMKDKSEEDYELERDICR